MATVARPAVLGPRAPAGPATVGALRVGPALLALLVGAALWEATSRFWAFPFQPPIAAIAHATWRMTMSGEIPGNLGSSVTVLSIGWGMATLTGVPTGLALGRYRLLSVALDPYIDALLAVPNLLLVPVFFGILGLGRATQIAVVFLYSFVVIATTARSGLATVGRDYVDMARVFGASEPQIFRQILLPGALPAIMAGLRLGISRAVRALIGAEMLLGPIGLGALLRQYGGRFDAASVFGVLAVLVALALIANYVVLVADRRLNHWANG
jgi:NitT/TauT family transport system permease protein